MDKPFVQTLAAGNTTPATRNDMQPQLIVAPAVPVEIFSRWSKGWTNKLVANAQAYISNRAPTVGGDRSKVRLLKILNGPDVQFLAAHTTRFEYGALASPKAIKHIVIHRPGSLKDTTLNLTPIAGDTRAHAYSWMSVVATFTNESTVREDGLKDAGSTHFVIGQAGEIIQMVDLEDGSRHVGATGRINDKNSIGMEIEGAVEEPISTAAMQAAVWVTALICREYGLFEMNIKTGKLHIPEGIIWPHSKLSHDRTDPGKFFDMAWFKKECDKYLNGDVGVLLPVDAYKPDFTPEPELKDALVSLLNASTTETNEAKTALYVQLQDQVRAAQSAQEALSFTRDQLLDLSATDQQKQSSYNMSNLAAADKVGNLLEHVPKLNAGACLSVRYNFGGDVKSTETDTSGQKPFTWMDGKQV